MQLAATAAAAAVAAYILLKRRPTPIAIPQKMAAVVARDNKCVLQSEWPTPPPPAAGEVCIQIRATAVNRLDCIQRSGKAPVPPNVTEVLGLEAAGVIAAVGSGSVSGLRVGDEVLALLPGGGYADYVCVNAATVMRKPRGLSWAQAASIPEAWLTAYKLVHLVANVQAGDVVLIHAAASGVGMAAVQLVVAAGASALVTVGTREKLSICVEKLGALGGAVRTDGPWLETITQLVPFGKKGITAVLDPVASGYAAQNLEALTIDGRWVLYSLLTGPSLPEEVAKSFLGIMAKKRISLLATTLRTRPLEYKRRLVQRFSAEVLPKLASGSFRHVIDQQFVGLEWAQAAHELMESNANAGKIVLALSPDA